MKFYKLLFDKKPSDILPREAITGYSLFCILLINAPWPSQLFVWVLRLNSDGIYLT